MISRVFVAMSGARTKPALRSTNVVQGAALPIVTTSKRCTTTRVVHTMLS